MRSKLKGIWSVYQVTCLITLKQRASNQIERVKEQRDEGNKCNSLSSVHIFFFYLYASHFRNELGALANTNTTVRKRSRLSIFRNKQAKRERRIFIRFGGSQSAEFHSFNGIEPPVSSEATLQIHWFSFYFAAIRSYFALILVLLGWFYTDFICRSPIRKVRHSVAECQLNTLYACVRG